jgi:hypothetical protein
MGHLDVETIAWKELSDWDTEVTMKNLLPVWVAGSRRSGWLLVVVVARRPY